MELIIRSMMDEDWPSIADIYKQGIETGNATFEAEVPSWDKWNSAHLQRCRIVGIAGGTIIGWAALTPVSGRRVYAGVAEVSVYVSGKFQGLKIGTKLLERLIAESEVHGIWTLQAVIFRQNKASLKIHENLGFRLVGFRERIGKMNGIWRDTLLLERRSKTAGV